MFDFDVLEEMESSKTALSGSDAGRQASESSTFGCSRSQDATGLSWGVSRVQFGMRDGERSYAVMPDGVGIRYEVLGSEGPCVVLIPGGQGGVCDGRVSRSQFPVLRRLLPANGFRVLLHDRRNTGSSDVGYAGARATEAELQAEDLTSLLQALDLQPAVLVGNSSGGRLSLLVARRCPTAVRALVLMNLTGGPVAAKTLANGYYRAYAAVAGTGMAAVAHTRHYSELCRHNSLNRARLEQMSPTEFSEAMRISAEWLESSADFPVLGHSATELARVQHRSLVVFSMHAAKCPMHTMGASVKLHAALPGADGANIAQWQSSQEIAEGVFHFCRKQIADETD